MLVVKYLVVLASQEDAEKKNLELKLPPFVRSDSLGFFSASKKVEENDHPLRSDKGTRLIYIYIYQKISALVV